MKMKKLAVFAGCAAVVITLCQGCVPLLVAGAAAGAAFGAVKYVENELQVTHEVSLDRAWDAANVTVRELQYPLKSIKKDDSRGVLEARNMDDQEVRIILIRQSAKVTQIRIRVGIVETTANKAATNLIYEKMKARF